MPSGERAPTRATPRTASPGSDRSTRRTTTGRSCSIPTATASEAVHHSDVRPGNWIDHLWIGVENLDRAAAFYGALGPHLGIRRGASQGSRRPFRGAFATFSLVADGRAPTRNLHMAFPAPNRRTVDGFHAGALAAGYSTNGAPGERPDYHPGYYGAFVLDPDGTNVESVYHGRG